MDRILSTPPEPDQAALWFLGQAGYIIRSGGVTAVIDPYLSNSVAKAAPEYSRALPVPLDPGKLKADIFIVTHDHLDHLDPETITAYRHKEDTVFIGPPSCREKLTGLGVPDTAVRTVETGDTTVAGTVTVTGVFAVGTEPAVADTTGYLLEFENGRSVYHTSDTGYSAELLAKAPGTEVLLTCINGRFGNLNIEQAVQLASTVRAGYTIPNHYDMMALNAEDPEAFKKALAAAAPELRTEVLSIMEPFTWDGT